MKTISKILYSIISFSVFVAYKVSAAYSATTIKLISYTLMTTSTSEETCKTVCKNNAGITTAAVTTKDEIWQYLQTAQPESYITLCNAGSYLASCIISDTSVDNTSANQSKLTSCTASGARCYACPNYNGKSVATVPETQISVYTSKTWTLCSTQNLTPTAQLTTSYKDYAGTGVGITLNANGTTSGDGKCMRQQYSVNTRQISSNTVSDCYVPANTSFTDNTGTYVNPTSCPYK